MAIKDVHDHTAAQVLDSFKEILRGSRTCHLSMPTETGTRCQGLIFLGEDDRILLGHSLEGRLQEEAIKPWLDRPAKGASCGFSVGDFESELGEFHGEAIAVEVSGKERLEKLTRELKAKYDWFDPQALTGPTLTATELRWMSIVWVRIKEREVDGVQKKRVHQSILTRTGAEMELKELVKIPAAGA